MGCVPSLFQFGSYAVEEAHDGSEKPEKTPPPPSGATEEKKPAVWTHPESQIKVSEVPSRVKEKTPPQTQSAPPPVKEPEVTPQVKEKTPPQPEPTPVQGQPETVQQDEDYSGADVQDAVVKIQAGIRGYLTRKALKEDSTGQHGESGEPVTQIDVASSQEASGEGPKPHADSVQPEGDGAEEKAAVKIQSLYRGYRTRKQMDDVKDPDSLGYEVPGNALDARAPSDLFDIENDEDLEQAATKVQAQFRGFQVRKQLKEATPPKQEDVAPPADSQPPAEEEDEEELAQAAVKLQAQFRGFQARKQLKEATPPKQEDVAPPVDTQPPAEEEDEEELAQVAVKLQAQFRGFQARKQLKEATPPKQKEATPPKQAKEPTPPPVEEGGDEDEEELANAAIKIQAQFRGLKVRKQMKEATPPKDDDHESTPPAETVGQDDDEELANAATKIQAQFRGYQVRKQQKGAPQEEVPEMTEDETRAATKIQSVYRGYKVRKDIKKTGDEDASPEGDETLVEPHPASSEGQTTFPSTEVEMEEEEEDDDEEEEEEEEVDDVIHHPTSSQKLPPNSGSTEASK